MAFPTTISGVLFLILDSQGRNRPWVRSSTGDVYYVFKDSTNLDSLSVQKATDPPTSFTEIAALTLTGNAEVFGIGTVVKGDVIHIATQDADHQILYHAFDMSSDTFTTSNEDTTGLGVDENLRKGIGIAIRDDNSDLVVFYNGDQDNDKGPKDRVDLARRISGSWTADVAVDDAGALFYYVGGVVRGSSNLIHFTYKFNTDDSSHKSLSLPTTLSSAETLGDETESNDRFAVSSPVFYETHGGIARLITSGIASVGGSQRSALVDDDGTPDAAETINTGTVFLDAVGSSRPLNLAIDPDGKTFWAVWVDNGTRVIAAEYNIDDDGWTNNVIVIEDDAAGDINTVAANIYERDGAKVLAWVYQIGTAGAIKYDEFILSNVFFSSIRNRPVNPRVRM